MSTDPQLNDIEITVSNPTGETKAVADVENGKVTKESGHVSQPRFCVRCWFPFQVLRDLLKQANEEGKDELYLFQQDRSRHVGVYFNQDRTHHAADDDEESSGGRMGELCLLIQRQLF